MYNSPVQMRDVPPRHIRKPQPSIQLRAHQATLPAQGPLIPMPPQANSSSRAVATMPRPLMQMMPPAAAGSLPPAHFRQQQPIYGQYMHQAVPQLQNPYQPMISYSMPSSGAINLQHHPVPPVPASYARFPLPPQQPPRRSSRIPIIDPNTKSEVKVGEIGHTGGGHQPSPGSTPLNLSRGSSPVPNPSHSDAVKDFMVKVRESANTRPNAIISHPKQQPVPLALSAPAPSANEKELSATQVYTQEASSVEEPKQPKEPSTSLEMAPPAPQIDVSFKPDPVEREVCEEEETSRAETAGVSPGEVSPVEVSPGEGSPVEVSPVEVSPGEVSPVEVSSVEVSPVEVSPVEVSPVEVSPVEVSPVEVSPVEVSSVEASSVEVSIVKVSSGEVSSGEVSSVDTVHVDAPSEQTSVMKVEGEGKEEGEGEEGKEKPEEEEEREVSPDASGVGPSEPAHTSADSEPLAGVQEALAEAVMEEDTSLEPEPVAAEESSVVPSSETDILACDGSQEELVSEDELEEGELLEEEEEYFAPEGGRQMYNRDYLMSFRDRPECRAAPPGLEVMDCFFNTTALHSENHVGGGRKNRHSKEGRKIIHQPHTAVKIELHKAKERWVRTEERVGEFAEEDKETKAVFLKFQGILNKLTPQKFQALAEKTLQLPINTEERLSGVIDKIFRKALEEPNFSVAYANLCRVMAPLKVETAGAEGKTNVITFRRKLLTKCQQEFEKDKHYDEEREVMVKAIEEAATPEAKKQCEEELELAEIRARHRSLGNIRFIGELFKLKMLSETIMHECIVRLLRSSTDEESLECLSRLISTTGKDLDIEKAKPLIDQYFNRIIEIIKKGKISMRLKFMLQDTLELRNNSWIPRVRQDSQLKTIDQIHAEARMEAEQQKQMISQHQAMNYGRRDSRDLDTVGGRRKGRDSAKTGRPSDDWPQRTEKEKKIQKKPDVSRLQSLGKKAAPGQQVLRPTGAAWGKGAALSSMASTNHPSGGASQESKKPLRSNSSGSRKGTAKAPASAPPKRSHTHPDNQQRPSSIQSKEQQAPGSQQPSSSARSTSAELSDEVVERKSVTITNELCENGDFKEAVLCVRELQGKCSLFVREAVNHSLDNSHKMRAAVGKLFVRLQEEQLLTLDILLNGLIEVLELVEDYELDIPKVWDYLGEILAPIVACGFLPVRDLCGGMPANLMKSGKAAILLAKVLKLCVEHSSESAVCRLLEGWQGWEGLGVKAAEVELFLDREELRFLKPVVSVQKLAELLSVPETPNDDIMDWIERNCSTTLRDPSFVRSLTTAMVEATVQGSGEAAIFHSETFEKRMCVLKKYVVGYSQDSDLQLEVLCALQVAMAERDHPPKLLLKLFNALYDLECVSEEAYKHWHSKGSPVEYGRGNAVQCVAPFFEWLDSADQESENDT